MQINNVELRLPFLGERPQPKLGKHISTRWHEDQDAAIFELKALAAFEHCTLVQEVEFEHHQGDDQSYFQARGVI